MDELLGQRLSQIKLGDPRSYKGLVVIPILPSGPECLDYVTLQEALGAGDLVIAELPGGGSVPNLKAVNKGDKAVLLLDGEELVGAKQNRVLNATILLAPHSETIIPVSCTERGRWRAVSHAFEDSDVVAFLRLRAEKADRVTESLERGRGYHGDQGRVWEMVDEVVSYARVSSPTSAMKDVFASTRQELEDYVSRFPLVEGQVGLLVLLGEEVLGLDVLSRTSAYARLHRKLLGSYAMEAVFHPTETPEGDAIRSSVDSFLRACQDTSCKKFESVGMGFDYRCRGDSVVGAALAVQECVVHVSFFRIQRSHSQDGKLSSFGDRLGRRLANE